ncbi:PolC-type DNA polymerase III [Roseivirga sp. BDSF3-8]|uniref:3'-5' exonuclease n=1 Tax=Roseivirga sp. BDSF3-8 TaxID=3241598 RepID=UPI0035322135
MKLWRSIFHSDKYRPAYWEGYKKSLRQCCASHLPLEQVRFVVYDTETTGLDPSSDSVLSIGAIGVKGGAIHVQDSFECVVHQAQVSRESISVHGLTPGRVLAGIPEKEAIHTFINYIKGSVLVAHHAAFDRAVINNTIKKHYHAKLLNKILDTATLAIRLEKFGHPPESVRREEYTLDALCKRYNIRAHDRHTAPGDSFITAQLFQKLLRLAHKRGIKTLGDLLG